MELGRGTSGNVVAPGLVDTEGNRASGVGSEAGNAGARRLRSARDSETEEMPVIVFLASKCGVTAGERIGLLAAPLRLL